MGSIFGIYRLTPHPDTRPGNVDVVSVQLCSYDSSELVVEFHLRPLATVSLPPETSPSRTDDLWRTTCFEVFLKPDGSDRYFEFNLSPSFAWAAYEFEGYRQGRRDMPLRWPPETSLSSDGERFFLYSELDIPADLVGRARLGLSAVIEEQDGTKSYWALAHPAGAPDFHHADCFAIELGPPEQP